MMFASGRAGFRGVEGKNKAGFLACFSVRSGFGSALSKKANKNKTLRVWFGAPGCHARCGERRWRDGLARANGREEEGTAERERVAHV